MDLKRGILQELEAIKEGFNDAEEMDGYDLANERFHLENAIALVKKLTIPVVSQQRELLIAYRRMIEFDIKHEDFEESVDHFLEHKESYL